MIISIAPPFLELPKLQKAAHPNPDKILSTHSRLTITPETDFWEVWENGPQNESYSELSRCMVTLGKTFCQMVKLGQGNVKVSQKTSPQDLVTEMDRGIEMLLRLWIKKFYPHHKIVGEEGYKESFKTTDCVWYIDPVDGTSNFVEGNERVAMHVGCFGHGKTVFSMVGIPIQERLYFTHCDDPHTYHWNYQTEDPKPVQAPAWKALVAIGTEYMDSRKKEASLAVRLTQKLLMPHHRVKSIGINVLDMIEKEHTVFYRNRIKLWDIMAPLGVLAPLASGKLKIELGIPSSGTILTAKNCQWVSPFSNDEHLVHWINNRHKLNSRVGLILVYPVDRPDFKMVLTKAIFS